MDKSKIDYLKEIYREENDRQKIAETKLSQIISSSGIFLTVIGIIITLLVNSRDVFAIYARILLVFLILLIVFFYIKSMIVALDGLEPTKFNYQRGDPKTVNKYNKEPDFNKEIIEDYISSINVNSKFNDDKFNFLIKARSNFVRGIYTTGFLVVTLIIYIAFLISKPSEKIQKISIVSSLEEKQLIQIRKSIDSLKSLEIKIVKDR